MKSHSMNLSLENNEQLYSSRHTRDRGRNHDLRRVFNFNLEAIRKTMTTFRNYWVTKRYQVLPDNQWMMFVWGMQTDSMLAALMLASRKLSYLAFTITEHSEKHWSATDLESGTRYEVEMRDTQPEIPKGAQCSIRDQTIPPNKELKRMPKACSIFQTKLNL